MDFHQRRNKIALAASLLLLKKRALLRHEPYARRWKIPIMELHREQGAWHNLVHEMAETDKPSFNNFLRVQTDHFNELLGKITPDIQREDTVMRECVSPGERLAITLRFLATGETFNSLQFLFRRGERTISDMVPETCRALHLRLKDEYLKPPTTTEEWEAVAAGFQEHWNFPNCLGALDGKHVVVHPPKNSGSYYYNYKGSHSVILMALVDADYKFLYVDVGKNGRAGDAGVFNASSLNKRLLDGTLNIPPPARLPGTNTFLPYAMVADDAFTLRNDTMKPYGNSHRQEPELIFDYRLSRSRRIVENAFGILANKFCVFLDPIYLEPEKVEDIVLGACALHNYLRTKSRVRYLPPGLADHEDPCTHIITPGKWRKDETVMIDMEPSRSRNPPVEPKEQRNTLRDYFLGAGKVPWQEKMALISQKRKAKNDMPVDPPADPQ